MVQVPTAVSQDGNASKQPKKNNYNVRNSLVNYYLLLMFTFFPIFLTDQYVRARYDKLFLFLGLSGVLIISVFVVSLVYYFEDKRSGVTSEKSRLSVPDIAFISFFICATISTLFSAHLTDALLGTAGRNNGLGLLLVYLLVYLIISRFHRFKEYVVIGYIVFASFVALLAMLHFFYIDPFGLLSGYSDEIAKDFGSTIGNKNTISSFLSLFFPVAVMVFVLFKKKYMRIIGGVGIFFATTGLMCSNSSSSDLALLAAISVMAILCSRKYDRLKRYLLALTIVFASIKLLRLFSLILSDKSKGFETFPKFLIYSPWMYIPIVVCGGLYALLLLNEEKWKPRYKKNVVTGVFIALVALAFFSLLSAFFYFSVIDTKTDLGALEKVLRFNERWGTHRGLMWIGGMQEYAKFDFFKMLFGSGPDTFYYVFEPYFEQLKHYGDTSTDCIHNEYLNYLITQGALGLICYLTLLISVIIRAIKKSRINPINLIFLCGFISYAAQSIVNLYQPISTPIFFLFIAITESFSRLKDEEYKLIKL